MSLLTTAFKPLLCSLFHISVIVKEHLILKYGKFCYSRLPIWYKLPHLSELGTNNIMEWQHMLPLVISTQDAVLFVVFSASSDVSQWGHIFPWLIISNDLGSLLIRHPDESCRSLRFISVLWLLSDGIFIHLPGMPNFWSHNHAQPKECSHKGKHLILAIK